MMGILLFIVFSQSPSHLSVIILLFHLGLALFGPGAGGEAGAYN
jgi:hypothetical protein